MKFYRNPRKLQNQMLPLYYTFSRKNAISLAPHLLSPHYGVAEQGQRELVCASPQIRELVGISFPRGRPEGFLLDLGANEHALLLPDG